MTPGCARNFKGQLNTPTECLNHGKHPSGCWTLRPAPTPRKAPMQSCNLAAGSEAGAFSSSSTLQVAYLGAQPKPNPNHPPRPPVLPSINRSARASHKRNRSALPLVKATAVRPVKQTSSHTHTHIGLPAPKTSSACIKVAQSCHHPDSKQC